MSNDALSDAILTVVKAFRAFLADKDDAAVTLWLRGFFTPGTIDQTPPSIMSAPVATLDGSNQPVFTWSAGSDDVGIAGYVLSINGGADINVGNVLTYTYVAAPFGGYFATVLAIDTSGNRSVAYSSASNTVTVPVFVPPLTDADLRAAGYILLNDYSVDATGVTECSTAIQTAIDAAVTAGKPLWVPTGTYKINKPLFFYRWQLWNTGTGAPNNPDQSTFNLEGAYNGGGVRPVFKLASGVIALFDDVNNPAPMFGWKHYQAANSSATSIPSPRPANPFVPPANFNSLVGSMFYACFRGVDFDTNGHAGAIGGHFPGSQTTQIERIKVTATGSLACFSGIPHAGGAAINLEGVGAQYCLKLDTTTPQGSNGSGAMITGLKMSGQTVQGILQNDFMALSVAGLDVTLTGAAVFWKHTTQQTQTAAGTLTLQDATINQAAGLVFDNASAGKSLYLRNVYVTGTTALIKSGSQAQINGSGTWSRITEYSYCDQTAPATPYPNGSLTFKTWNIVTSDGAKTTTAEKLKTISINVSSPPANIVTQHYPAVFDKIDTGDYVSILDYGAVRVQGSNASDYLDITNVYKKTGQVDCKTAIQNAIDAARTAGHNRVLIPFGAFPISGTVTMHKDTKMFGIGGRSSSIVVHESWRPTTGSPVVLKTDADVDGTATLGYLWITVPEISGTFVGNAWSGNRFNWIQWNVGRRSITSHVWCIDQFETSTFDCAQGRIMLDIGATGGGRHYGFKGGDNWTGCHKDSRMIRVKGTTQPTALYAHNMELAKSSSAAANPDCGVEITDSSNVRCWNMKREGRCCSYIITNSTNVGIHGHGVARVSVNSANNAYIQVKASANNVLITIGNQQNEQGGTSRLIVDDGTGLVVTMPECLSVYKKGTGIDDIAMVFV